MAVKTDNQYGSITISNNVIANAAGIIATSCYGVVGMAIRSPKDGIVSLLKPSNLAKGIKISVSENEITVDMFIVVQYGVNINAICESIIHGVKYRLSELIGMDVKAVNVFVESIRVNS
ncbi:MAG: Asp23/Gls24 family envelope stress response protein [Clostridia bacterium]|nr:Asp23/Gls24 family envelope stress response protein [Clostridia bacterium]MBR2885839.1 Asp23/Gls24 family envelope stress response protein [Clostridia bacterium]